MCQQVVNIGLGLTLVVFSRVQILITTACGLRGREGLVVRDHSQMQFELWNILEKETH